MNKGLSKYFETKHIKKWLILLGAFFLTVIISCLIFLIYFNSVFKNFFAEQISNTQQKSIEKIENEEYIYGNIASLMLENYDIMYLLRKTPAKDIDHIRRAISHINSLKPAVNIKSVQIADKSRNLVWEDTSMVPLSFSDYEKKDPSFFQTLEIFDKTGQTFYNNGKSVTFAYSDYRSYYIFLRFEPSYFSSIIPTYYSSTSDAWLYYNSTLLYSVAENSEDILLNEHINKNIAEGIFCFSYNHHLYVINTNGRFLLITAVPYADIISNGLKTSVFIWLIALLFILLMIGIITITSCHFNKIKNIYISKLATAEYRSHNDMAQTATFKIFSGIPLNTAEMHIIDEKFNSYRCFIPVIIKIDDSCELSAKYNIQDIRLFKYGILNIAEELFSENGICLSSNLDDNLMGIIAVSDNISDIDSILISIRNNVKNHLGISLSFAVSNPLENTNDVILYTPSLNELIKYCYITEQESIIHENNTTGETANYPFDTEHAIINALDRENAEIASTLIDEFVSQIKSQNPILSINWFYCLVVSILHNSSSLRNKHFNHKDILEICDCDTVTRSAEYLKSFLCDNMESTGENTNAFFRHINQLVQQYYSDPNLDLAYISNLLNMNKVYLGRKFKSAFSITFAQYLTKYRINIAKHLLQNPSAKISDVSVQCGFSSTTYFVTIFKKHTGLTPAEFKQINENLQTEADIFTDE